MNDQPDRELSIPALEDELRSYGISVETVDRTDSGLELTYMTAFPGNEVHRREMGRALNGFLELAETDVWEPERVDATVVRMTDDVLGTWHADPAWFDALLDDDISETEFSTRVLDTISGESR
ncbi:hypothetical protein ACNS7O_02905 [Haloferacaceae archaeon DSL9]